MIQGEALSRHRIEALTDGIYAVALYAANMFFLGRIGRRIEAQPETNP